MTYRLRDGLHNPYVARRKAKRTNTKQSEASSLALFGTFFSTTKSSTGAFLPLLAAEGGDKRCFVSSPVKKKIANTANAVLAILVRETGLEPVRVTPHAPQTCASADSATLAIARILYHFAPEMSSLFQEKVRAFFTFSQLHRAHAPCWRCRGNRS